MSTGDSDRPQLRPVLTSRERQDLINRRETGWMRGLQSMAIDVGHHPFLSAGDSEIVEARFFERLRLGTPYKKTLLEHELSEALDAVKAAATADRAVVVFSLDAALEGIGLAYTFESLAAPRVHQDSHAVGAWIDGQPAWVGSVHLICTLTPSCCTVMSPIS